MDLVAIGALRATLATLPWELHFTPSLRCLSGIDTHRGGD